MSADFRQGPSSIELLVVLIVMFLLMAVIMIMTLNVVNGAKDAERKSNIAQFMKYILIIKINNGTFPIEKTECNIGKDCYNLDSALYAQKLDYIPQDPRGGDNYYKYQSDGYKFILKCKMSDNTEYSYISSD